MKLILLSVFLMCPVGYAAESSTRPKSRARILTLHQSFLDLKNEQYPRLPEHLIKLSVQCAEGRKLKACRALVKGVEALVEQQKRDCPTVLAQAAFVLDEYRRAKQAHVECLRQNRDDDTCEKLRIEAQTFFQQLDELNKVEPSCLGFRSGVLSPLAECENDSCAAFARGLYEHTVSLEHDRPELLFRARMLYYAVGEYRELTPNVGVRTAD